MKKTMPLIIAFLLFISISSAFAETKTFIKEYTYQASELDSKASCRTIALEQVKRLLLEELGTYLENNTEVKNLELTKDKITALTAGIVQTQVLNEKWDGKCYWLKAEVKADPQNVVKSIDSLRKDQKKSDDLEERVRKLDEALKEIAKLKSDVALLKNDIKAQEKYNKSIDTLTREEKATAKRPSTSAANEIIRDGWFIAYDNGTVVDTKTNLMWAAKDNAADINWWSARKYCESYRGGGYTDWRMPTQDEVAQLLEHVGKSQQAYRLTRLIHVTECCLFVSDTGTNVFFSGAPAFNLQNGSAYRVNQFKSTLRVLPVRSGK